MRLQRLVLVDMLRHLQCSRGLPHLRQGPRRQEHRPLCLVLLLQERLRHQCSGLRLLRPRLRLRL